MNNACPTCGAVYAVSSKDIGRKLKCKKCSTALAVTDAGLVVDSPTGSAAPVAATPAIADDFGTGDEVVSKKKPGKKYGGPGAGDMLAAIGGIPTILFAFGTFLVIWFTFMTPIGVAAIDRAEAGLSKLRLEKSLELKKLLPKGKKSEFELEGDERKTYDEKKKKIEEDYAKRLESAEEDAASTQISNVRSVWYDKYGQLFGFVLLAFGCIGYLRTEQPLTMKIVAAVVLGLMLLMVFNLAVGGCNPPSPRPITKGGFGGGGFPGGKGGFPID
jgi:predicted Zn finger-like uncharacterized protein